MEGALTVFIQYVPNADTVVVGISDGPPPSAPPPPAGTVGNGTCGATSFGGDCNVDPKGAWDAKARGYRSSLVQRRRDEARVGSRLPDARH